MSIRNYSIDYDSDYISPDDLTPLERGGSSQVPHVLRMSDYSQRFVSVTRGSTVKFELSRPRIEKLASRVELAERPNHLSHHDLIEIFMVCRPPSAFHSYESWGIARAQFIRFWQEGADESAALKLMAADWFWRVGHDGGGLIPLFTADIMDGNGNTNTATAEIPSHALTAAALRVRARQAEHIGKPDQVVAVR